MRYQGKIISWNTERGFGFIVWNGGGEKIFVHVSQLSHKKHVPEAGDVVTYELGTKDDKGQKAVNVIFPNLPPVQKARRGQERDNSSLVTPVIFILLIGAAIYWWFGMREPGTGAANPLLQQTGVVAPGKPAASSSQFSCEGKTRCPQMGSCAEATFYIQHCPKTEMDGDGDGVPCESQWCQ